MWVGCIERARRQRRRNGMGGWAAANKNVAAGDRAWKAVQAKDDMFVGEDFEVLGKRGGKQVVLAQPGKEDAPAYIIPPEETW